MQNNFSSNREPWKKAILLKLQQVFPPEEDDGERVAAFLFYLNSKDDEYKSIPGGAPAWRMLHSVISLSPLVFRRYAEKMFDETKQLEPYQSFYRKASEIAAQLGESEGDFSSLLSPSTPYWTRFLLGALFTGLPNAVTYLENCELSFSKYFTATLDDLVGLANSGSLLAALSTLFLVYQVGSNIRLWWKGTISGQRCVKNIIDSTGSLVGGIAGGYAGATFGASFGPLGVAFGGLLGSLLGLGSASWLSDYLTSRIFELPKDVTLEKAYSYFGVKYTASEGNLKIAYKEAILKAHPDKGGKKEDFLELQMYWSIIRNAREDERCQKINKEMSKERPSTEETPKRINY